MFKYIFILLLLSSCSAQWHYDKACKKDSVYCGNDVVIDTFVIRDTFEYHRVDTTNMIDTITIDTGSIQVKIIRNHDVIRTTITQKPDTTRLTIYKKVPPKIIEKFIYPWWLFLLIPLSLWLILRK
jgi:predicted lipase